MSSEGKSSGRLAPVENDVALFGRITASVTHELNNVISIIEQTAGLLDDLVAGEERGIPIATERLISVSASIQKQTQRGLNIIERLNRFAHTTDTVETRFDLDYVVGNLVQLSRRAAGLCKVTLDYQPYGQPIEMTGSPFAAQLPVFNAVLLALTSTPPNSTVVIATCADSAHARVSIQYPGTDAPSAAQLTHLKDSCDSLNIGIETEAAEAYTQINVRFQHRTTGKQVSPE